MKSLRVSRGKVANGDSQDRYPFISTSAGTPMFLAHPATKRGEARESKSVAPSRHRTPRQDHSRKSTLSRRSAKTKWLSDPESGISPNNCLRDGTVKNALQSCKFRRMILEMLTNLNPRCDFASCCCTS